MLTFKQFLVESEDHNHIHYSHSPSIHELDGKMFGSGIKGAEEKRLAKHDDPKLEKEIKDSGIRERSYAYNKVGNGKIPRPEGGLGKHTYSADFSGHNIYDTTKTNPDAHKITATTQELEKRGHHQANAFEMALRHHGHHAYTDGKVTVALGKNVPVKHIGTTEGKTFGDNVPDTKEKKRSVFDGAPNKEGHHTSSSATNDQTSFYYKHKDSLQKAAPSFNMQYGRLSVHKDHLDALHKELEKHPGHPL